MARPWEADPDATWTKRLGKTALELGNTSGNPSCPDIWELSSGDFAIVGRDLTHALGQRLPSDVSVGDDERVVVIPRNMLIAAKADIPGV